MTNAELAILSLVVEQPRHGYEIEQIIEERGMREWTEVGFSSIYYLLKKLEQAGLVVGRLDDAGPGPARRVYEATPAGNEALRREMPEIFPAGKLVICRLSGEPCPAARNPHPRHPALDGCLPIIPPARKAMRFSFHGTK